MGEGVNKEMLQVIRLNNSAKQKQKMYYTKNLRIKEKKQ